jgi:hypothetical protein
MRTYGLLVFLLLAAFCGAESVIPWSAVTSGGGEAEGGTFLLEGTAGQSAAGISEGADRVLNGGYRAGSCGCVVNLDDLAILGGAWLADAAALNLSGDTDINWYDFVILAQNWLGDCPAGWPVK